MVLKLDKEIFGFRPGQVSKVMIGVEGFAPRATSGTFWDCDGFFVFSIADKQYFVFVTDFDKLGARINFNYGTYIYPRPGSDNIASGNASTTFDNAGSWTSSDDFPETLGGGDEGNYGRLSAQTHGNNWPIIFELINDDINNTFTFRFSSPKFDGSKNQPLESTYKSSVGTSEDIKLYFSVEAWHSEMIQFESFTVVGIDTGDLDIRNSENYWYFGFILCYNTIVLLCC